jgi:hypothetical protein
MANLALATCNVRGPGWKIAGACRVLTSPASFPSTGWIFYDRSLRWVRRNIERPVYIVRPENVAPFVPVSGRRDAAFSRIAIRGDGRVAVYAVGTAMHQLD